MPNPKLLQTLAILTIIALNSYAIAEGVIYQSYLGILLAIASLAALGYCIHLIKKLKQLDAEEEEQQLFH